MDRSGLLLRLAPLSAKTAKSLLFRAKRVARDVNFFSTHHHKRYIAFSTPCVIFEVQLVF
jgi:hypothetical protein